MISRRVLRVLLYPTVLLLVLAGAWLLNPGEASAGLACRRLGTAFFLGAGALAPLLGRRLSVPVLLLEGGLIVLAWAGAVVLAASSGLDTLQACHAGSIVALAWAVAWCWTTPLRGLGLAAVGPVLFLLIAGGMAGTPYLLDPHSGAVPGWALDWNPLIRLHQGVEGRDWLRTSLFYSRLGEKYFAYPRSFEGGGALAGSAGLALCLALGLHWIRRNRFSTLRAAAPGSGTVDPQ